MDLLDESLATLHTSYLDFGQPEVDGENKDNKLDTKFSHPWVIRDTKSPGDRVLSTAFDNFLAPMKEPDDDDVPQDLPKNCFMTQKSSTKLTGFRAMSRKQSTMSFRVQSAKSIQSSDNMKSDFKSSSLDLFVIPPIAHKTRATSATSAGHKARMPKIADVQEDLAAIIQQPENQAPKSPVLTKKENQIIGSKVSIANNSELSFIQNTSIVSHEPILSSKLTNTNIPVGKPRTYLFLSVINTILFFPFFTWIPGLFFSMKAREKFKANDQLAGKSMAKFALISSVIGILLAMILIVIIIVLVVLLSSSKTALKQQQATYSEVSSTNNPTIVNSNAPAITNSNAPTTTTSSTINLSLQLTLLGHTDYVNALVVLPFSGQLASAADDYTIRIWDTNSGTLLSTLTGHTSWVNALTCLSTGYLASASWDNTMRVWNTVTASQVSQRTDSIDSMLGLDNGLLAFGSGFAVEIWSTGTSSLVRSLTGHANYILSLTVLQDGSLVSGSEDRTIKIWNTNNGTLIRTLVGHTMRVNVVTVLSNGYIASGSDDMCVKVWNPSTGALVGNLTGHTGWVNALAGLQGNYLASGSHDDTIRVWNWNTGQLVQTLTEHASNVLALSTLSNGYLASGSSDTTIKLWRVDNV